MPVEFCSIGFSTEMADYLVLVSPVVNPSLAGNFLYHALDSPLPQLAHRSGTCAAG